ncbi:MAG: hypothetical protein HWE22_10300 [Flavobacteriales bacterium]|nr:hypothetical protein [Flavobacteriales bacterium]
MNPSLHIKTIHYLNLPIKSRYLFLKHLQREVHEFALNRQSQFLAAGTTAEYFHKDKGLTKSTSFVVNENGALQSEPGALINGPSGRTEQSVLMIESDSKVAHRIPSKKQPPLIHAIEQNGNFALRAYTPTAVQALDFYQELLSEVHPEWTDNCIESVERCSIRESSKPFIYESTNWLPYRDCFVKNGIYYDKEKNVIANFDNRIQGNLGSFMRSVFSNGEVSTEDIKKSVRILQLTPQTRTRPALLIKDREIKKYAFRIQISIPHQLPHLFSLGQNAAFGNGVFRRIG